MLPDCLVGPVALDRLGADIPVADPALRIEHVDSAIANTLDQEPELLLAGEERALGFLLLADIARDLGESDKRAVPVPYRVDNDACPETRAVLAHTPALGFIFALFTGGAKRARRQSGLAILVGEEAGEMLADDLVGFIALEAARSRIPGGDTAVRLEHIEGVIGDRIDQKLEFLVRNMRIELG